MRYLRPHFPKEKGESDIMGAVIELICDALRNFAVEIIVVILLVVALERSRLLRFIFRKYRELTEGESESNTELTQKERKELEHLRSEKQMRELQKEADAGNAKSQCILGNKYYRDKNYTEAAKWYRKAADQGYVYAVHNLGNAYYNGRGVGQDYSEAFRLYRIAAYNGYAQAQYFLGNEYYYGKKLFTQNYAEALMWYKKAANQGHARAQYYLGNLYMNGWGVEKNYDEAAKWYSKAIDGDDDEAKKLATEKLNLISRKTARNKEAIKS